MSGAVLGRPRPLIARVPQRRLSGTRYRGRGRLQLEVCEGTHFPPWYCVKRYCSSTVNWRRSEEHTSELQSLAYLVCRLLLEKKKYRHDYSSNAIFSLNKHAIMSAQLARIAICDR